MTDPSAPRAWSLITGARLVEYCDQAQRLVQLARRHDIEPFAAAMAGVALIRSVVTTMGGDMEWWVEFLRSGELPAISTPRTPANDEKAGT